jgi:hypothetical protein
MEEVLLLHGEKKEREGGSKRERGEEETFCCEKEKSSERGKFQVGRFTFHHFY